MAALHSLPPRKRPRVRSFLRKRVEARRVVALLPAHDEEAQIGDALASLRAQNRPPDVVVVVTDTATLFRTRTLRHVIRARASGELPGDPAVYDTHVLTEDNELTLALLHLGYTVTSPPGCRLTTEVMESWSDLYRQCLRWKR